jgi:hypothetical protein
LKYGSKPIDLQDGRDAIDIEDDIWADDPEDDTKATVSCRKSGAEAILDAHRQRAQPG